MEEKEKIALTIFGVVAIIAVVGLIGIFNKPTYILLQPSDFEIKQTPKTESNPISGMAVSNVASEEACIRYKRVYKNYGWFDDWQWFKDNCASVYDLSEPERCTTGYLDEYNCEGDYLKRKWQNSRCDSILRYFQYCKYGCSDGKCKTKLSQCTEKYLYDYRCHGSNSQRLYQNTDCTTYYREYEICNKGCNSGTGRCNAEIRQTCNKGYLDEYVCSGNYLRRTYQYSNCVKVSRDYQFCNNGCSNNACN